MTRWLVIILMIVTLWQTAARAEVVVILRREAEANGDYIRVCDIARVEGPKEQASEISRAVIGPTPARGQSLQINRWDVEARLFEMGLAPGISFSGNDTVTVIGGAGGGAQARPASGFGGIALGSQAATRPANAPRSTIPPDPLAQSMHLDLSQPGPAPHDPAMAAGMAGALSTATRDRVGKAISAYLAGRYRRDDVEVEATLLSASDAIPSAVFDVAVGEAVSGQVPGMATLRLLVRETPDTAPMEVMVSAKTEVYGLAPVAAKQLYKGEILEPQDVLIKRVRMEAGNSYLPPHTKAVAGRELRQTIQPGQPILASITAAADAVKRGDRVKYTITAPTWSIEGFGKALSSGKIGDRISVEDRSTKKKYDARVVGRAEVAIDMKKLAEKQQEF